MTPSTRSLLENIQGTLQQTNMIRGCWMNETRWLLAVDSFLEVTMEKSILDIQLMNGPIARSGDAEDSLDGGWFHHQTESHRSRLRAAG